MQGRETISHRAARACLGSTLEAVPGAVGQGTHFSTLRLVVGYTVNVLRYQADEVLWIRDSKEDRVSGELLRS